MMLSKNLAKWMIIALLALTLGYFAFDNLQRSPQQKAGSFGSATLSWTAPIENMDESQLTDLVGYVIYYSEDKGDLSESIYINDPQTTTYTVENLAAGTYYFSISAREQNGNESALSNVIAKTVP